MPRFSFTVDEPFARQNNELLKDSKRLQISALVLGLVLVAGAVGVFLQMGATTWGWIVTVALAIMAILSFIMVPIIPKQVGSVQSLYDRYELVPAIVAEKAPGYLVLLALVNINTDPSVPPKWALASRTVDGLGAQEKTLGAHVPSVAVTGRRSAWHKDKWDEITPMPIAWGTPDKDIVRDAEKQIPRQLWQKLESNVERVDEVQKTTFNLLELDD